MNFKLLLSTSFIALSLASTAQDAGKTFAITGDINGSFNWRNIRQVDLNSGKTTGTVLDAVAATKWQMNYPEAAKGATQTAKFPTETMVAAAAYDKKHNKLFFAPMKVADLRWIDLSAKGDATQFYSVENTTLKGLNLNDEASQLTRMDIGADGNGYAVSNDANHLIRFTTGKKTVITDLGNIIDAESNAGVSVHNKCTSWGGDMIADAYGKLYIITAAHHVFEINVETRIATHLGVISNLPANYTTNGAAVSDDGSIIVSSANMYESFYKFNLKDLAAVKMEGSDKYNASDLANGNLLYQKEADAKNKFTITTPPITSDIVNTDSKVYPNPVTGNEFKVLIDGQKAGTYSLVVTDLSGKVIMNRIVNVAFKSQVETVKITNVLGKGMYFVKVTDAAKQVVLSEKIIVQ
jgi:ribosomal protein S8E